MTYAALARALAAGAARSHILDVREEFVRDFILPSLKADALLEGRYPMATALGRPLIAKKLVEVAHIENATIVAHGCTGRDDVRCGRPVRTLDPALVAMACADVWGLTSAQVSAYAERLGMTVPDPAQPRTDDNLWGRTMGRGEHSGLPVRAAGPARPAVVDVAFTRGVPTALNGVTLQPVELIASLSTMAGEHGCGRLNRVKTGADGSTSRVLYAAPAAIALHLAHRELVATSSGEGRPASVAGRYTDVIDRGEWFEAERAELDASMEGLGSATGTVRLRLSDGACQVVNN